MSRGDLGGRARGRRPSARRARRRARPGRWRSPWSRASGSAAANRRCRHTPASSRAATRPAGVGSGSATELIYPAYRVEGREREPRSQPRPPGQPSLLSHNDVPRRWLLPGCLRTAEETQPMDHCVLTRPFWPSPHRPPETPGHPGARIVCTRDVVRRTSPDCLLFVELSLYNRPLGRESTRRDDATTIPDRARDEAAIRALESAYDRAWNARGSCVHCGGVCRRCRCDRSFRRNQRGARGNGALARLSLRRRWQGFGARVRDHQRPLRHG